MRLGATIVNIPLGFDQFMFQKLRTVCDLELFFKYSFRFEQLMFQRVRTACDLDTKKNGHHPDVDYIFVFI